MACADPKCGDELRYDRDSELCACPNGGRYQPGDGGWYCFLPDGSVTPLGDAGPGASAVDGCEPRTLYRDADGDGFGSAARSMEACGEVAGWVEDATDCDDACETCFPGAEETCNGRDDDCDLVEDEGLVTSTYYVDCDGDGYAPAGASAVVGCAPPERSPDGCADGGWTTRAPTTGATDCADHEPRAYPGQTEWFETAIPGAPAAVDFDYDCDGVETKQIEFMSPDSYRACSPGGDGICVSFGSSWRYLAGGPPACGVVQDLNQCFDGCMAAWAPYRQRCR